jgi:transposase-like protein
MSEDDLIDLDLDRHEIKCPHCQRQTVHYWPGKTILFATVKCMHCGKEFLIVLNEPRARVLSQKWAKYFVV